MALRVPKHLNHQRKTSVKKVFASFYTTPLRLALLPALLLVCRPLVAEVSFSVTPAAVSDQYTGPIMFQISGLTNGETVRIGKYFDANTNGVIDGQDFHVLGMKVTDGRATVIGGVTNINMPGDWDPNSGLIQFQLSYPTSGIEQRFLGTYAYVLLSSGGRFAPMTNSFTVTNSAYGQSLSGAVQCEGTNVPYAGVMLFAGAGGDSTPVAGTVANASGNYSLRVAPGTYQVWAFRSNYVADMTTAPEVTLGVGETQSAELSLLPATCSISGQYVFPNLTQGISGLLVVCQSTNNQIALGFTDTNGNFTVPVVAGEWEISNDSQALASYGLLGLQSQPRLEITSGNQVLPLLVMPGGGAQFFGTVSDDLGRPLTGVRLSADDDGNQYEAEATTDQDGYYVMMVKGGGWNLGPAGDNPAYGNYIFSDYIRTNLSGGQSVPMNFRGIVATNQISGYVRNSTNGPIAGLEVQCGTASPINGVSYHAPSAHTDDNGYYSFHVANGTWTVQPTCDGDPGLNQLGYPCVNSVNVVVSNNNAVTNFVAETVPTQISGYVRDSSDNPVPNLGLTAYNGINTYVNGGTDGSGHYVLGVSNGSWEVSLLCCGSNSLSQLGYMCVGAQQTNVFNNTAVVNFTVPPAPVHISGYLREASSNPIPNVQVSIHNPASYLDMCPAITDAGGYYSFYVTNGTWRLTVDCAQLTALGYMCLRDISVSVSGADVSTNFTTLPAPFQLSGWLKDAGGNPITNMSVYAYATISGVDFWLDSTTDSSGNYSDRLAAGLWHIGVNCGGDYGLLSRGYQCVEEQAVTISSNSVINFTAASSSSPLQLTTTLLPDGTQNAFYSTTLTASGGQPPYSWALAPGSASLPYYLTLSTNGVISGIPASAGASSFIVRVADAAASTVDRVLTLSVTASTNQPVVVLTAPQVTLPAAAFSSPSTPQPGSITRWKSPLI